MASVQETAPPRRWRFATAAANIEYCRKTSRSVPEHQWRLKWHPPAPREVMPPSSSISASHWRRVEGCERWSPDRQIRSRRGKLKAPRRAKSSGSACGRPAAVSCVIARIRVSAPVPRPTTVPFVDDPRDEGVRRARVRSSSAHFPGQKCTDARKTDRSRNCDNTAVKSKASGITALEAIANEAEGREHCAVIPGASREDCQTRADD